MTMSQRRTAGQDYLKKRILDYARAGNIPIDDPSWYEPTQQDVSEVTVTRSDKKKKKTTIIENIELEDDQRRGYLDQVAETIVKDFS